MVFCATTWKGRSQLEIKNLFFVWMDYVRCSIVSVFIQVKKNLVRLSAGTEKSTPVSKICNVHYKVCQVINVANYWHRVDFNVPVRSHGWLFFSYHYSTFIRTLDRWTTIDRFRITAGLAFIHAQWTSRGDKTQRLPAKWRQRKSPVHYDVIPTSHLSPQNASPAVIPKRSIQPSWEKKTFLSKK